MKTPARSNLDSMIVGIELTLVSIIQGVALYFLIESTRGLMTVRDILFWPYILSALLVIFVFWSRSVLHIITVIRWPLEFGHNFLYFACALFEALLFTRLHNPRAWFAFGAVFGAVGWSLFVYDLRLIGARARDSAGPASDRLNAILRRDQWLNITVLVPAVFLFNLVCYLCIRHWPELFLGQNLHVWLAAAQLAGFSGYLFYVTRYFKWIAPLIAEARAEWHLVADEPPGSSGE
ncbi:MAG TPA: hypothetical protein VGG94_08235 [Chthoniobacterales bacterium]